MGAISISPNYLTEDTPSKARLRPTPWVADQLSRASESRPTTALPPAPSLGPKQQGSEAARSSWLHPLSLKLSRTATRAATSSQVSEMSWNAMAAPRPIENHYCEASERHGSGPVPAQFATRNAWGGDWLQSPPCCTSRSWPLQPQPSKQPVDGSNPSGGVIWE